jgi:DNA processing protein
MQDFKTLLHWIRLIGTESIGPVTFRRLCQKYGSPEEVLNTLPSIPSKKYLIPPIAVIEEQLELVLKHKVTLLTCEDPRYPSWLRPLESAPPLLYARGNIDLLSTPQLGVVGSRAASLNGIGFTNALCQELGNNGLTIVSGLALGIDAAAHKGSLDTGTIAVLGGGTDVIYPRENYSLFHEILQKGLILSEFPMGTKPIAQNFPRRNRILSGMCQGMLVVEAKRQSGSMITAEYALEYGRSIFAVPGFPYDPRSEGPNQLLYDGAHLVRNSRDILEVMFEATPKKKEPSFKGTEVPITSQEDQILSLLSTTATDIDEIIRNTGLSSSVTLDALLTLEVEDKIIRNGSKVMIRGGK